MEDEAEAEITRLTSIPDVVRFIFPSQRRINTGGKEMVARSTGARRKAAAPATRRPAAQPARKAAAAPKGKDVSEYADKPATGYHKAFAAWIVNEVGYDPNTASSLRAAFLKGVSIATAARPAFNSSDAVEAYREKSGEAKRGPKPAAEKAAPAGRRRKPAPVVEDDDDFEEEEIEEESDDIEEDDDDFEEDDTDDDDAEEDDDDFEEDEEEAPAPKRRAPAKKAAPARRAPAKKAAPAKRTRAAATEDDDFLF